MLFREIKLGKRQLNKELEYIYILQFNLFFFKKKNVQ